MSEQLGGDAADDGIEGAEQVKAGGGDLGADDAAVAAVAVLEDEAAFFEAGEKTGDVGLCGDHAAADLGAGEASGDGSTKDAEHVVLRGGDAPGAGAVLKGAVGKVGGAHDVEQSFLL